MYVGRILIPYYSLDLITEYEKVSYECWNGSNLFQFLYSKDFINSNEELFFNNVDSSTIGISRNNDSDSENSNIHLDGTYISPLTGKPLSYYNCSFCNRYVCICPGYSYDQDDSDYYPSD